LLGWFYDLNFYDGHFVTEKDFCDFLTISNKRIDSQWDCSILEMIPNVNVPIVVHVTEVIFQFPGYSRTLVSETSKRMLSQITGYWLLDRQDPQLNLSKMGKNNAQTTRHVIGSNPGPWIDK